jgi:hypothetical protein
MVGYVLAQKCYLQAGSQDLFFAASSSGGGLPGRLRLERVRALVISAESPNFNGKGGARSTAFFDLQSSKS